MTSRDRSGTRELKVRVKSGRGRSHLRALARASAQRSLCRARQARRLSLARRLQTVEIDDKLSHFETGRAGGRSRRGARRLEPGRGKACRRRPAGRPRGRDRCPATMPPIPGVEIHAARLSRFRRAGAAESHARRPGRCRALGYGAECHRPPQDRPPQDHGAGRKPPPTFACEVLSPGGTFLAKVLQGGTEAALLAHLKRASPVSSTSSRRPAAPIPPSSTCWRRGFVVDADALIVRTVVANLSRRTIGQFRTGFGRHARIKDRAPTRRNQRHGEKSRRRNRRRSMSASPRMCYCHFHDQRPDRHAGRDRQAVARR